MMFLDLLRKALCINGSMRARPQAQDKRKGAQTKGTTHGAADGAVDADARQTARDQGSGGAFGSPMAAPRPCTIDGGEGGPATPAPSTAARQAGASRLQLTPEAGTPAHAAARTPAPVPAAPLTTPLSAAASDLRTPAAHQAGGVNPQGSAAAAPRSGASGSFVIESGKTTGIANTVSKYAPNRPLAPHVTPFERRVEKKLQEEEEVVRMAQRG